MNTIGNTLHPDAGLMSEMDEKHGGQAIGIAEAARTDARRWMNAIKTIGPALKKTIEDEPVDAAVHFQAIMTQAETAARDVVLSWGIDPDNRKDRWIGNMVEKALMPYIDGRGVIEKSLILEVSGALVRKNAEFHEEALQAWRNDSMVEATLFGVLMKMSLAQARYTFERPAKLKESDLTAVRDEILAASVEAMEAICPEMTGHDERVTFVCILLEQHGDLMQATWDRLGRRAGVAAEAVGGEQFKTWRNNNPNGFPLDPVLKDFRLNAGRLLRLTVAARKSDRGKPRK